MVVATIGSHTLTLLGSLQIIKKKKKDFAWTHLSIDGHMSWDIEICIRLAGEYWNMLCQLYSLYRIKGHAFYSFAGRESTTKLGISSGNFESTQVIDFTSYFRFILIDLAII
jgi:hypothetical protein